LALRRIEKHACMHAKGEVRMKLECPKCGSSMDECYSPLFKTRYWHCFNCGYESKVMIGWLCEKCEKTYLLTKRELEDINYIKSEKPCPKCGNLMIPCSEENYEKVKR